MMTLQTHAVIAAGGLGTRMNLPNGKSKQFLTLRGKPLIIYTLLAFELCPEIEDITVALTQEGLPLLRSLLRRFPSRKPIFLVEGGKERQDSIFNALQTLKARVSADSIIHIHDGARPFIQPEMISTLSHEAHRVGAALPFTKPKDTIKSLTKETPNGITTLNRSQLRQVQTPQSFRAALILEAHQKAHQEGFYGTDDATLIEAYFPSQPISFLETDYTNIKITTPEDLPFARAIIQFRKKTQS